MTQAFWKKVWTISLSYMRVLVSYCVGVRLDSQCGLIFARSGCNIAFVDRRLANYPPPSSLHRSLFAWTLMTV